MHSREQTIERIEQYLHGELSDTDRRSFEAQMNSDPSLQQEVELHRGISEAVTDRKVRALEQQLHRINKEYQERSGAKTVAFNPRLLVAASILVIFIVSAVLLYTVEFKTVTHQTLYTEHFEAYPLYQVKRSVDDTEDKILQEANRFYQEKAYGAALEQYQTILDMDPDRIDLTFYTGICLLSLDKTEEAKAAFHRIIQHKDNLFVNQSKWYLALAHLKLNQIDASQKVLNDLQASDTGKYGKLSVNLLEELEAL